MKLEVGKNYLTRNGQVVQIIDCDKKRSATYPYLAKVEAGDWISENGIGEYTEDGRYLKAFEDAADLVLELNEVGKLLFL